MDKMEFFPLYDDIAICARDKASTEFVLEFAPVVKEQNASNATDTDNLISEDKPNNLTLGSDNKLLVANAQTNLTAIYLLNRGELV